jgi:glycosyltransferase involved in cell wall biosynthesis
LTDFKAKYYDRDNISFMGFRSDFLNAVAIADAYIHVSGLDNQPYSIIDALMLGKVIVCNDLESLTEMIDPENNYIVPLRSSAVSVALRSLIDQILKDPNSFKAREQQNKLFAIRRHSRDLVAEEYLKLYDSILQKGRKK